MSPLLILATLAITAALALYTSGVFWERRLGRLDVRAAALFWLGLACDTTGTTLMSLLARSGSGDAPAIHGVTGAAAIALMLFHACWAALVLWRGRRSSQGQKGRDSMLREQTFHRFSTTVWLLWLVPYLIGLLVGIPAIHLRAVCATGTSVAAVTVLSIIMFKWANSPRARS